MNNGLTEESKRTEAKKKRRHRNKKNKNSASTTNKLVSNNDTQNKDKNSETSKKNKKGRKRDDRYYGIFHCKKCNKYWESAHVYTIGGTKKVKFRQACEKCKEYHFPYRLQILRCSQCFDEPCSCNCEVCGKLRHKRYIKIKISDTDDSEEVEVEDPAHEYCECDTRKIFPVGAHIDPKKNHRFDLCERCQKGIYCSFRRHSKENDVK